MGELLAVVDLDSFGFDFGKDDVDKLISVDSVCFVAVFIFTAKLVDVEDFTGWGLKVKMLKVVPLFLDVLVEIEGVKYSQGIRAQHNCSTNVERCWTVLIYC